jgi:hypothetical protein
VDGVEMKICGKCKTAKTLETFNNCKQSWDKLRNTCKECLQTDREVNKDRLKPITNSIGRKIRNEKPKNTKRGLRKIKITLNRKIKNIGKNTVRRLIKNHTKNGKMTQNIV